MADNNEPTLQNALDAVSRSRKWALVGMTSLFFVVTIALAVLSMMVVIPSAQQGISVDVPSGEPTIAISRTMPMKVLWIMLAAQLFFVVCGTITVILHVSRMTRAVLRAIETSRR